MIPIENSQAGRVADIHFLLPESGLSIVGEYFMPIHHALMGIGQGPFKAAYSHVHALGQSRHYLAQRNMVPLSHADTAGAAAYVKELGDPAIAAIARHSPLISMGWKSSTSGWKIRKTTPPVS